jgi:hypothetical protein
MQLIKQFPTLSWYIRKISALFICVTGISPSTSADTQRQDIKDLKFSDTFPDKNKIEAERIIKFSEEQSSKRKKSQNL